MRDGVLTHAGLAFSRDGPRKVYIQHKMIEDAAKLAELISAEAEGAFYLCGPTWPVPDIYVALTEALKGTGKSQDEAEAYLAEMKEEERYILEVY